MSTLANQAAAPQQRVASLRDKMPKTADWVDRQRTALGKDWVNDCIRRAQAGEAGRFYAMEAGHVLGTPFPADHPIADLQRYAVIMGTAFAGFIDTPPNAV
jgi:hypothetical protein